MLPIRELAPAKINLTLSVRGRRPDGYHALASLVTFADISDVVVFDAGAAASVRVSGPFASDIGGENLLVRALSCLREAEPKLALGSVFLDKHLPVAAGLGGGSADAAALLRAVRRANPTFALSLPWRDLAARLGADVPVCLDGRPAVMWGIGEKTTPLPTLPPVHSVLVNPAVPLSTADVFDALQAGPAQDLGRPEEVPELRSLAELVAYMRTHRNDLERPAARLVPAIGEVQAALAAATGCRVASMTGSGPTCFGIFGDRAEAERAAERLQREYSGWWVKATLFAGAPA